MKNIQPLSHALDVLFLAIAAVISIWIIGVDAAEYLTTHHRYIYDSFPEHFRLVLLICSLVGGWLLAVFLSNKNYSPSYKILFFSAMVLILVLFGHTKYSDYSDFLREFPVIKKVSKNWSIQGDRIAIEGRGFGGPWQNGSVSLGDLEYTEISWSDNRVVVEQPLTSEYFSGQLKICNYKNKCDSVPFQIRNPAEVL